MKIALAALLAPLAFSLPAQAHDWGSASVTYGSNLGCRPSLTQFYGAEGQSIVRFYVTNDTPVAGSIWISATAVVQAGSQRVTLQGYSQLQRGRGTLELKGNERLPARLDGSTLSVSVTTCTIAAAQPGGTTR